MTSALRLAESVCLLAPIAPLLLSFSRLPYTRKFWMVWGGVVCVAALWAMFVGLADALGAGTVSLPAGRGGKPRPVVPWLAAWAYFSGLLLTAAAAALVGFVRSDPGREWPQWIGVLCALAGWVMLAFWREFSSLSRAGFSLAFASLLGVVVWLGHRFGKRAAVAAWIGMVACVGWFWSGG